MSFPHPMDDKTGFEDDIPCPDCNDWGFVYTMADETQIGQPPGSSRIPCPTCRRRDP